ncbi:MAG: hypothetical protein J7J22_04625 [Candidatus Verstraetearchaeota archaeon]|nr:hypothetical protein [Candidatus Verstraetearchaeota archaeon]
MKAVETPRKPEPAREGGKGGRPTPPERTAEVRVIDVVAKQVERINDIVNEMKVARYIQSRLDPIINRDYAQTMSNVVEMLEIVKDGLEHIIEVYTNLSKSAKEVLR